MPFFEPWYNPKKYKKMFKLAHNYNKMEQKLEKKAFDLLHLPAFLTAIKIVSAKGTNFYF